MPHDNSSAAEFDPYLQWFKIPPAEHPPDHYQLLGLQPFESDLAVIEAAVDERVDFLQDVATGSRTKHSQQLLNEVATARICLTDTKKKAAYDEQLRAPEMPFAPVDDSLSNAPDGPVVIETGLDDRAVPAGGTTSNMAAGVSTKKKVSTDWLIPGAALAAGLVVTGAVVAVLVIAPGEDPARQDQAHNQNRNVKRNHERRDSFAAAAQGHQNAEPPPQMATKPRKNPKKNRRAIASRNKRRNVNRDNMGLKVTAAKGNQNGRPSSPLATSATAKPYDLLSFSSPTDLAAGRNGKVVGRGPRNTVAIMSDGQQTYRLDTNGNLWQYDSAILNDAGKMLGTFFADAGVHALMSDGTSYYVHLNKTSGSYAENALVKFSSIADALSGNDGTVVAIGSKGCTALLSDGSKYLKVENVVQLRSAKTPQGIIKTRGVLVLKLFCGKKYSALYSDGTDYYLQVTKQVRLKGER